MHRFSRWSRALIAAVLVVLVAVPAAADEPSVPLPEDPHERLAEIRRRQAATALEVDVLSASAAEVRARLAEVEAWVAAQQQVVAATQADLVDATLAAADAREREEAKAEELVQLEELMAEVAVEAFMQPRQVATLSVLVEGDLDRAAKADVMLRARNDRDLDIARELERAERQLRELRRDADREANRAQTVADEAASALDELDRARAEQLAMAERIQADLADASAHVQQLHAAEADATADVEAATAALLARVTRGTSVTLVEAAGFRVHADIASAVEALVEHAARDGIVLRGWGARTTEQQVALRRQHCGGPGISDADAVYVVPPAACSPPTAKPGTSMHELGLAIDFTHDGSSITSRTSPAFLWLAANAGDYGFFNVPSEPWHWSVNGQ